MLKTGRKESVNKEDVMKSRKLKEGTQNLSKFDQKQLTKYKELNDWKNKQKYLNEMINQLKKHKFNHDRSYKDFIEFSRNSKLKENNNQVLISLLKIIKILADSVFKQVKKYVLQIFEFLMFKFSTNLTQLEGINTNNITFRPTNANSICSYITI